MRSKCKPLAYAGALAIILLSLGGCSKAKDVFIGFYKTQAGYIQPSEIVLPAGTMVEIGGVTSIVSGFSNCPQDGWYWGHPQTGDKCVVISKDNKLLQVLVYQKDGQSKQAEWSVVRKDGGIFLKDSSGAPVMRVSHE